MSLRDSKLPSVTYINICIPLVPAFELADSSLKLNF